ncbi:MAG: hypothetical protein LBQ63_01550 [Deltaproteobacteria bacterium]|jgi:transposase-like protein|nr:hypothetical protein [Deltaproteobacteria bacterium]
MTSKNRYARRSHISEGTVRDLIKLFAEGETSSGIARALKLNRNTVNRYLTGIRKRIAVFCEAGYLSKSADYELYCVQMRQCDRGYDPKEEQDAATSFAVIISSDSSRLHAQILSGGSLPEMLAADGWIRHNCLGEFGYMGFFRPEKTESGGFSPTTRYRKILRLRELLRQRFSILRGIQRQTFYLHLKECEFRCNYSGRDIYAAVLRIIQEDPLD